LWQHLADRGFAVFQVDNRGSGGRGRAFAQKVHKELGKYELEDQIAAAKYLAALPYVDAARIGIYGHSYGGFMAALAMLDGGGVFQAGVAGSPVTDWALYDTGYTERYMETPATNKDGYEASDLSKKAVNLTGKLLLTHASMDENVHYANTAKLVDALIAADKRFELFVLPGERHGLRVPAARAYMPERIATFFAENL
jgi:dipeptidyl-peptidase-4